MKEMTFRGWLVQAFELANKKPMLWLGCVLIIAVLLALGRVSLALAIVASVCSIFIGVGIVAAIDRQEEVGLFTIIRRQLPLALSGSAIITVCWFVFRVIANIRSGERENILYFFYHWELTLDNLSGKTLREQLIWLYSPGIVALLLVLLMLASFGNWFSYPLMLFERFGWFAARDRGRQAFHQHAGVMYKLSVFVMLLVLIGMGLVPLLTPLCYMLVSTLMYVSYRDVFVDRG